MFKCFGNPKSSSGGNRAATHGSARIGVWIGVVIVITATNCGSATNSGTTSMGSASMGRARDSAAIMGSTSGWSTTSGSQQGCLSCSQSRQAGSQRGHTGSPCSARHTCIADATTVHSAARNDGTNLATTTVFPATLQDTTGTATVGSVANIGRSIRTSYRDTIGSGNLGSAINSGGDRNSSASTIDVTIASTHAYKPAEL